jgi:hypothetical protein
LRSERGAGAAAELSVVLDAAELSVVELDEDDALSVLVLDELDDGVDMSLLCVVDVVAFGSVVVVVVVVDWAKAAPRAASRAAAAAVAVSFF